MEPGRVEDAADLVFEHHGDGVPLKFAVAFGVGDEQGIAVLPGFILGAVDDLAGERCGGDRVGDQSDEPGTAADEVLGHGVGPVPKVLDRVVYPLAGFIGDPGGLFLVHHQGNGGSGDAGGFGYLAQGDGLGAPTLPEGGSRRWRTRTILLRIHLPSFRSISACHPLLAPLSRPWIIALLSTRKTRSRGVMVTQTAANVAVQSVLPIAPM